MQNAVGGKCGGAKRGDVSGEAEFVAETENLRKRSKTVKIIQNCANVTKTESHICELV